MMNKKLLVEAVAEITGDDLLSTEATITAFLQVITHTLASAAPVRLTGVGTLEPYIRTGRVHRNPRTGDPVVTDDRMWTRLRPAQRLQDYANGTLPVPADPADIVLKSPKTRRPQDAATQDSGVAW